MNQTDGYQDLEQMCFKLGRDHNGQKYLPSIIAEFWAGRHRRAHRATCAELAWSYLNTFPTWCRLGERIRGRKLCAYKSCLFLCWWIFPCGAGSTLLAASANTSPANTGCAGLCASTDTAHSHPQLLPGAGSPVQSPPAISNGLCLFSGCSNVLK